MLAKQWKIRSVKITYKLLYISIFIFTSQASNLLIMTIITFVVFVVIVKTTQRSPTIN